MAKTATLKAASFSKSTKLKRPRAEHDVYWKLVLDKYLQPFLEHFYPEAAQDIDWAKGYRFLDKELERIARGSKKGRQIVDKLVSVYRLNGDEQPVLIHLELQGKPEEQFAKRMYRYYHRLWDYYERPIASIAVFLDTDLDWQPRGYSQALWGCESHLRFKTVKLLAYQPLPKSLENHPLGMIITAYFSALKTQKDAGQRYDIKLHLTKSLYQKGLDKETILELYTFIDMALALPEGLEVKYTKTIEEYEEQMSMPYITSAERIGIQKGIEQGIQQGLHQGLERGLHQGIQQGEANMLMGQLETKFGHIAERYSEQLSNADVETLLTWSRRILTATTLEAVFAETDSTSTQH